MHPNLIAVRREKAHEVRLRRKLRRDKDLRRIVEENVVLGKQVAVLGRCYEGLITLASEAGLEVPPEYLLPAGAAEPEAPAPLADLIAELEMPAAADETKTAGAAPSEKSPPPSSKSKKKAK